MIEDKKIGSIVNDIRNE